MSTTIGTPKARPAASGVSLVLALALVGVAVVAVRDLAVDRGWTNGTAWTGDLVDRLDGTAAGVPAVIVGVVLALAGLWLVLTAVRPAASTHEATSGPSDVWITRSAVRAVATGAAEHTPGVAAASSRHRRGRVVVTVQSDRPGVAADVETAVRTALDGLSTHEVTVRTEEVKHDS